MDSVPSCFVLQHIRFQLLGLGSIALRIASHLVFGYEAGCNRIHYFILDSSARDLEIFVLMAISLVSLVLQVKEGPMHVVEGVGVFEEEDVEIKFAGKVKRSLSFGGGWGSEEVEEG
ncbi:hypothetical protein LR48_Vigan04g013100 [Vigna angularis]|uniref:Uncharacterized protein n=1 Tax=Phaseolus angularis TaxID=3914 RepID=A0A0L9UB08_PHAAN|nr:hypothetical protein LR48_Vigan04g013100 [Vigna angularis]